MNIKRTVIAAAISAAISAPVAAQLEEVIVTAQKRAESLQDVPVAVSAFQGDQLENFGITDTKSLQAVTPSLVFNNRGPVAQPFIRGIGTTLSLLGLVLAIGIVVDDAIVVVEAVTVKMEQGMSPKEATIAAMKEVSGPIVATSLVLVAVFLPVAAMGGITGRLYQQFAITIAISVMISSVNALTLSPLAPGS